MTLFLMILLSPASAQTFDWSSAAAGDRYPNAVLGDLDGDGADDLVIGIPGRCGHIEIWLSSDDPDLGFTRGETSLTDPTVVVRPPRCDPSFGSEVAISYNRSGEGILGTVPDAWGRPLATVSMDAADVSVTTSPGAAAGACECSGDCCDPCVPCSGPAPCCGQGGGGIHITMSDVLVSS